MRDDGEPVVTTPIFPVIAYPPHFFYAPPALAGVAFVVTIISVLVVVPAITGHREAKAFLIYPALHGYFALRYLKDRFFLRAWQAYFFGRPRAGFERTRNMIPAEPGVSRFVG